MKSCTGLGRYYGLHVFGTRLHLIPTIEYAPLKKERKDVWNERERKRVGWKPFHLLGRVALLAFSFPSVGFPWLIETNNKRRCIGLEEFGIGFGFLGLWLSTLIISKAQNWHWVLVQAFLRLKIQENGDIP